MSIQRRSFQLYSLLSKARAQPNKLHSSWDTMFRAVWMHPRWSPQEILNEFGTEAGKVVSELSAIQKIYEVNGTTLPKYIVKLDGTVFIPVPVEKKTGILNNIWDFFKRLFKFLRS
jgi:hypothetical protein